MIQLDTILTYDIEIDFISENEIVLNFDSGLSVYANGVKKVSGVKAIDFFDGTNTSVQVDLHNGRARVYINSTASGGGSGSVTSVSFTGGIVSVANPTTTPALTVAGTSGGIPYFSSASTWASSAELAANALMIGGGAGAAPATTTTGTGVLTFLGTPSWTNFSSMITGTAPFWSLASGGALTADNTISGNYAKYFTGTGVFVIGGNSGTAKFRVVGNGATTGELERLDDGSGTPNPRRITLDNGRFAFNDSSPTGSTSLGVFRGISGDQNIIQVKNAAGNDACFIGTSGEYKFTANMSIYGSSNDGTVGVSGTGIIFATNATFANATSNFYFVGTGGAFNTTGIRKFIRIGTGGGSWNPSSSTGEFANIYMDATYNASGTWAGKVYGIYYSPTVSGIASGTHYAAVFGSGLFGIKTLTPTAILHLGAGVATANIGAPLKFTTGTNLTTAEVGAMEYNNTFHLTNSDATRRHIVLAPNTTKVIAAAPYTNDGYVTVNIGGTDFKFMTTA